MSCRQAPKNWRHEVASLEGHMECLHWRTLQECRIDGSHNLHGQEALMITEYATKQVEKTHNSKFCAECYEMGVSNSKAFLSSCEPMEMQTIMYIRLLL